MSLNIIFAGTPLFASQILASLLESPYQISAVLTQPDRPQGRGQKQIASPVKLLAQQHNLPVFQPVRLKEPEILQTLTKLQPDVIVVVAYGLLVPQTILDIPKYGCINVHASLLPRWRGAAPIQAAILAGDAMTGITIMQMDKGLDTGDMLNTVSCQIQPTDTSQTLHDRLSQLGVKALLETLEQLVQNKLRPKKQDNTLASYAPKIDKKDAKIHWQKETALEIERKIRAFSPWPVAFFEIGTEAVRVFSAEVLDYAQLERGNLPGTIVQVSAQGIDVATVQGILRLLTLQLPSRKILSVKDILNADKNLFAEGTVLP